MNLNQYLKRIGASNPSKTELSYLSHLQQQHVRKVPFENLDVISHYPLSLQIADLYHKIVVQERGGICHELNGLFHHLITNLGFQAHLHAATTHIGTGWFPIENTHVFNLVLLNNKHYLVDVGLGGKSPAKPVPLTGEEIKDVDGWYRVIREEDVFYLQKKANKDWNILYCFTTVKKELQDFEPICQWMQTSPESPFNKRLLLSKVNEKGRVTLAGNSLTIVKENEKTKKKLKVNEIRDKIKHYFGLNDSFQLNDAIVE
ncbi:arylamine N-acetyltransferase family protein [Alteribacillus bidgolensis]|uniref:N-hydroxyarylamine O-acetyltransferase n=1 Tax=Alteribacillus bidgolensis TaxID=930129 RepID=A0A1G8RJ00_9BACI|nr:arylamine N-acetyltransferase [Alteribacillus bidgolensis]SDJ16956.1 N-hydroxyarylamine O-acetyltransferase [Alteribacillus bidgolensis]